MTWDEGAARRVALVTLVVALVTSCCAYWSPLLGQTLEMDSDKAEIQFLARQVLMNHVMSCPYFHRVNPTNSSGALARGNFLASAIG